MPSMFTNMPMSTYCFYAPFQHYDIHVIILLKYYFLIRFVDFFGIILYIIDRILWCLLLGMNEVDALLMYSVSLEGSISRVISIESDWQEFTQHWWGPKPECIHCMTYQMSRECISWKLAINFTRNGLSWWNFVFDPFLLLRSRGHYLNSNWTVIAIKR